MQYSTFTSTFWFILLLNTSRGREQYTETRWVEYTHPKGLIKFQCDEILNGNTLI